MMSNKVRMLSSLGIIGAATVASTLAAGTAQAASWLPDPNSCTSIKTAVSRVVSGRTVAVRYGNCSGTQYGWGRITGYTSGDYIRFEVDINGDRKQDGASWFLATNRNYTAGYPTSSSSAVAFRACFLRSSATTCSDSNSTAWW
jgi:hypothetical protein